MTWLANFWQWFRGRLARSLTAVVAKIWARRDPSYRLMIVDDIPLKPKPNRLYVVGEAGNYWAAALICPCGCTDVIELNLLCQVRPCWKTQEHTDGSVSITPSVWRQSGCRSHFFLRRGAVEWC